MRVMRAVCCILFFAGIIVMLIGPYLVVYNLDEGPAIGPMTERLKYLRLTLILVPVGLGITAASGLGIVLIDRRKTRPPDL